MPEEVIMLVIKALNQGVEPVEFVEVVVVLMAGLEVFLIASDPLDVDACVSLGGS